MKLTQSQMSCSCSRRWENCLCADRALKKVLFRKVCHLTPMLPGADLQSALQYPKVGQGLDYQKGMEVFTFYISLSDLAAIFSQLSVAPRWWRTTTARQITPTPAWCRSLCTTWRLCCAARRTSLPTGSSCWGSHTYRASWVCAPASRTPWPPSGGGS